ncbi:MAG TPA: transglycosylase SLT domain-containing protein [Rhodanobacter sp.]|nr:transglycosylase SLT domain-containing protein [Rhodanobacter sp.]
MFLSAAPRRVICGLLAAAGALLAVPQAQAAASIDAQRIAFKQAYAAANQGDPSWRTLAAGLHDYPLYPYLPAAALEHDIRLIDRAQVEDYLAGYPELIPAADLRRDFLRELARRKDWTGFTALYQPGLGDALTCNALQASLAGGGTLDFQRDLAALWAKPDLPGACDPVLSAAHDQGLLTTTRLWDRIDRAAEAGKAGTVASLAPWLPATDQPTALHLAQAWRDPAAAVAAASSWTTDARNTRAATLALTRLARRQSTSADAGWQTLQGRFPFSEAQRNHILATLALFHATDFDDRALARLIALPPAAQTDATFEWRARVALARQNWPAVIAAIEAMPATLRQDGEWRYFHGRALAAQGHAVEAKNQFKTLADEATFFGFLAADELGQPYAICPLTLADDPAQQASLLALPGLQRALELFAVDLPKPARREWNRALQGADQATVRVAAALANQRGWYDRAVFAFSSGEALRLYDLRFPLASQDGLVPQAEAAGIDPAWAYGILRAESAWMSDARSGADARGLMQLLPSTGALVARRNGMAWGGGDTLYDPVTNIALGTRYLAHMASRFDGSPWLASAAYNAGPNRVDQWLAARGTLAPDVFIASIPFKETREYVARVMAFSVIYDWRLNGTVVPLTTRLSTIGQPYATVAANAARKTINCPSSAAPAAATSATPVATSADER